MVGIYYKIFNDYYNFLIFKIVVCSIWSCLFTMSLLRRTKCIFIGIFAPKFYFLPKTNNYV